jgi:hypothetical protein
MVSAATFKAHLRSHRQKSRPTPVESVVAVPRAAVSCLYCSKVFAKFSTWAAHENACEEESRITERFFTVKPVIYEF